MPAISKHSRENFEEFLGKHGSSKTYCTDKTSTEVAMMRKKELVDLLRSIAFSRKSKRSSDYLFLKTSPIA